MDRLRRKHGFTLVELLIVVAILGILSAVVVPIIGDHAQKAKESAAKESLQILRNAIERYAADHGGVPPGYLNGDPTNQPSSKPLSDQLFADNNYVSDRPQNPFNESTAIKILANGTDFPSEPSETDSYGWIYQPQTKQIRLNWAGTDTQGKAYFGY